MRDTATIVILVALTAAACGDSPTGPSAGTRVEAVVQDAPSVPSSSYSRVRLVFQGVTARIARGSVVGGTTLTSDTTVVLGGSDARAEMSIPVSPFSVEADARVRRVIVFDLRSQQWLTAAALQSGRVEDGALQTAVTATTRSDNR